MSRMREDPVIPISITQYLGQDLDLWPRTGHESSQDQAEKNLVQSRKASNPFDVEA
jgi:hypothetical protein